jgi:hypothetical protein
MIQRACHAFLLWCEARTNSKCATECDDTTQPLHPAPPSILRSLVG